MSKEYLSVAKIVASTSVDGPGLRTSLYLQGCPIKCPGCHNANIWDIEKGEFLEVDDVFTQLIKNDENISILGGEPLFQYDPLLHLCERIRKETGKSIWLWSGYECTFIAKNFPKILNLIDVLIDGPFISQLAEPNLTLRGSTNQMIWPLSAKGAIELYYI